MNNQAFELLKAFIRLTGVTFLLDVIMELSHLPEEFLYLSGGGPIARVAMAAGLSMAFRCVVTLALAVIFLFFASTVARFFSRTLSPDSPTS
jgi:hypothetical protein